MSRRAVFQGNPNLYWISILFALVLVSYGSYWQRGGYADDFAFLGYLSGQTLSDAIVGWGGQFNSRLTQSVLIPPAFSLVEGASPGEAHWWFIHLNAVLMLCVIVYLLYKILELFPLSRLTIFITTLVFALHPIKTQVVFWPATIFGYLFPMFFFMLGTYLYFRAAGSGSNKPWHHVLVFFLMFIAACGIEQLIPLVFLVLVVRMMAWRVELKVGLLHCLAAALLTMMVVGVILAGRTMDRVEQFGGMGFTMVWERLESVLVTPTRELLGYPARFLLDGYFYDDVLAASQSPAFLIAIIVLAFAMLLMTRIQDKPESRGIQPCLTMILVGVMAIFLPLTPFLVTSYYMPSRVLFIPSIGFALVCGAIFAMLWSYGRARWFRTALAGLITVVSMTYIMTSRTVQVQFADLWQRQEAVKQHLLQKYPVPESDTSFVLLHFPRLLGAVPTYVNSFTFPGMIQWLYRDNSITAQTAIGLSNHFRLDEYLDASQPHSWVATPGQVGIIYSSALEKAESISRLLTINETSLITGDYKRYLPAEYQTSMYSPSIAIVVPLKMSMDYSKEVGLELRDAIWIKGSDLICIRVAVHAPFESKGLRLLVHANYRNGDVTPYDRDLLQRNAIHYSKGRYYADVLIDDASSLAQIDFQLSKSGRVLSHTTDDDIKQPSMNVLSQALKPGIMINIAGSLSE